MFSLLAAPTTPANPILLFLLTLIILSTIYILIVVAETVVFQWMRWGSLRACIKAAAQVNTVTFAVGLGLMLLIPKPGIWQLWLFLAIAIVLEGLFLNRLRPERAKANWVLSIVANAVSYIVLILPPFLRQG